MTRILVVVLSGVLGVRGLTWMAWAEQSMPSGTEKDSVTVFITGCTLGSLRPCGCSGGQLGGLERRAAILHSVSSSHRLILDTGYWIKQEQEQDMIKARILLRAFHLLDYDVIHLSNQDLQVVQNLGLLDEMVASGGVIAEDRALLAEANIPQAFERSYEMNGRTISVRITSVGDQALPARLADPSPTDPHGLDGVDIYLVDKLDPSVMDVRRAPQARRACVIGPADSDEPRLWSDPNANPLVLSLGRYGRHVIRLQMSVDEEQARPTLQFSTQTVSEDLPSHPDLVALYKDYQQIVADTGLLGRHPKVSLPKDLEYVGSNACRQCHRFEYEKAVPQKHAQAYATLEKVGSHLDPECVVCHVVGLDYESGFSSVQESPDLKDVGCEACHGPGSEHVRTEGKAPTHVPKQACLDCHTPEQSRDYAGHERELLEKTRHWKELRKASGVKP